MRGWVWRVAPYVLALIAVLAYRGVLSIIHDGLSPAWLWP